MKVTVKWMKNGGTVRHGYIRRRDDQYEKLCLTVEGEEPDLVHEVDDHQICAGCIRRSIELSR